MMYITLYFLYAIAILFIMGSATRRLLEKISSPGSFASLPSLVNILIFGIITLTTLVSFVAAFLPITIYVHIFTIVLLLVYLYFDKQYFFKKIKFLFSAIKDNPYIFALGCMCLLPAIFMATGPVGYFDTGLYHAQAVKWINEHGTVPGLGNLHHRLAFNSSWFYFSAFFDISMFDGKTSHLVNLFPIALALIVCLSGFYDIVKGKISLSTVMKCFLALPLCTDRALMLVYLPTLSPDLVSVILTLYLMILLVGYIEDSAIAGDSQKNPQKETFILIFSVSFFLPTIKMNGLPALLFPVFLLIQSKKAKAMRLAATGCLAGGVVFLPFVVNNIILSGYLFFPVPHVDLFSFDWKMPYKTVDSVRHNIKYYAIHPSLRPWESPVSVMSTLEWMRFWYARQGKDPLFVWMIRSLFSTIIFFTICFFRKRKICLSLLLVQGIMLTGILFWFFSAPAYRFGKGWIWGFIILSLGGLVYLILKSARSQFVRYVSRVICVLVCISLINLLLFRWDTLELIIGKHSQSVWRVSPLPKVRTKAVKIHEGLVVNVPPKEVAWNTDLPSSPRAKHSLRMRGNSLNEGFRVAR